MTREQFTRTMGLFAVAGGILFAASIGNRGTVAAAQKDKEKDQEKCDKVIKLCGAAECMLCHNLPKPEEEAVYKLTQSHEFIKLGENRIWSAHDMHSMAFKNLTTSRTIDPTGEINRTAEKMEENLRKLPGKEKYTVATDTNCLACHASTRLPIDTAPPAKWDGDSFSTRDGVGCEMCHGHGTAYKERHRQPEDVKGKPLPGEPLQVVPWREWKPERKKDWGFVNLRVPAVAAAKCSSCHVGNIEDGRFVTHEMFAVGHPPLPPLDLMAYSREQPRHWGLASEMGYLKNLAKKDPKKAFDTFHFRGENEESLVARRFAESTIGTLASFSILTSQLAGVAQEKNDGLDYAAFDCYSCHHDLKYPSDRQARGYDGPPGRPQFRLAPFALARLVVDHAAGMTNAEKSLVPLAEDLDAIQKRLALSFGNKTYGDPIFLTKATDEVKAWCTTALEKLRSVRYTKDETARLLAKIVEAASREPIADPRSVYASQRAVADPELAQVYVWAAETLLFDLAGSNKPPATVLDLRDALKATVVTRLRGPEALFGDEPSTHEAVDQRIGERMKRFNSFRGEEFRDAFKKLAPRLGEFK